MSKLSSLFNEAKKFVVKESPAILTGLGIGGFITTTILAVKATPKAIKLIEAKKEELGVDELTIGETIKTTWKCYISPVILGFTSTACCIGGTVVNEKRNAALATAYEISRAAIVDYREKVKDTIGEKKQQEIITKVAKDKIESNPVTSNEVIVMNGCDTLCYDCVSGRYFKSDMQTIKAARNVINDKINNFMYASLNEFYTEIGLPGTVLGEQLGWNQQMDIDFSSHIAEDGRPCLAINFLVEPRYDFSKLG